MVKRCFFVGAVMVHFIAVLSTGTQGAGKYQWKLEYTKNNCRVIEGAKTSKYNKMTEDAINAGQLLKEKK